MTVCPLSVTFAFWNAPKRIAVRRLFWEVLSGVGSMLRGALPEWFELSRERYESIVKRFYFSWLIVMPFAGVIVDRFGRSTMT